MVIVCFNGEIKKDLLNLKCCSFDLVVKFENDHQITNQIFKITENSTLNSSLIGGLTLLEGRFLKRFGDNFDEFSKKIVCFRKSSHLVPTASTIPTIKWSDVGGLEDQKLLLRETFAPFENNGSNYSHVLNGLGKRTGILLWGPPGTGKTLLAKAIATEYALTFIPIKGPELLSMYVGESEWNIRDAFEQAFRKKPSILFFDEIDSLLPARQSTANNNRGSADVNDECGNRNVDAMDRIVSQFITQLDVAFYTEGVYVIGATNRLDLLDKSLLRPGRFDISIHLPATKDPTEIKRIFHTILSSKNTIQQHSLSPDDIEEIEKEKFFNKHSDDNKIWSGAEIHAVIVEAARNAVKRKISQIEQLAQQQKAIEGDQFSFFKFLNFDLEDDQLKVVVNKKDFFPSKISD